LVFGVSFEFPLSPFEPFLDELAAKKGNEAQGRHRQESYKGIARPKFAKDNP
jgi:hypothetical protein